MADAELTGESPHALRREIGTFGAMMMGLGSIVGAGVFVSTGLAADAAGPAVLVAVALASLVAICNGLSSAQLAANFPVSGGTYEYGYRTLSPLFGFVAGWMFLCAKSASAATAALGFGGYLITSVEGLTTSQLTPIALGALAALTLVVLSGIRRSSWTNIAIVSVTILALGAFIVGCLPAALANSKGLVASLVRPENSLAGLLEGTALMFVAYTGYGRIATLGEEVREPRRTIPRAIIATLLASMALYLAVTSVGIGAAGAAAFGDASRESGAPLEVVAREFAGPVVARIVAIGAMTAMLGVLLNLLLGLSRVLLAMGRRGDMPAGFAAVNERTATPWAAVLAVAVSIAVLVTVGDIALTWSLSAFTVLIYYSLTNLAAIRLDRAQRMFPAWVAYGGLGSCLFLAFWVDTRAWLIGGALLVCGLLWRLAWRASSGRLAPS